jgi:hypothetical protein
VRLQPPRAGLRSGACCACPRNWPSLESGLLTSERSDAGCRAFLVTASNTVPATASGRLFCACVTLGRFCCRSLQPQPTALKPAQIKEVTSRPLVRPPENRADREALAGIGEKKPTEKGWFCEFWWPSAESNHGHADFQSAALPTELLGQRVAQYTQSIARRQKTWEWISPAARMGQLRSVGR